MIFYFYFVVTIMKLHALAGRSKNEQVVVDGEVRCASGTDCHPNCTSPYLCISLRISPPGTWSHSTPTNPHTHPTWSSVLLRVKTTTTATHLCITALCCSIRSALSLFHFRLANHGDTIRWCDTYALSGWSLFTCQSIRVSSCGRSDSHEASARKRTHNRQS